MSQINFRFWLYLITDFFYLVPVIFAILTWKKIKKEQKWFVLYLFIYFIINTVSNIMFIGFHKSNLFLFYFYSLADCIFILQTYRYSFQNRREAKAVFALFFFSFVSLLVDLFWITGFKNQENYFSESIISICILSTSLYYLAVFLLKNTQKTVFNEANLLISLSLAIKFFLKSIFSFIRDYLFETQSNAYLTAQIDNFYNFFIIITLLIISLAFYHVKTNSVETSNN